MRPSGTIEHLGIISEVSDNLVRVSVLPEAACGSCSVRSSCSIGETGEREIEVFRRKGDSYSTGEEIRVILEQSLGLKALVIGYILPFLVVLFMLILLTSLGLSEGFAGLVALLSLIPYYTGLSFFRDKLKKEFSFRLQKL